MKDLIHHGWAVKPQVLLLAIAAVLFTTVLINQWFFPAGAWKPIARASGGWLNATFQAGWISIMVIAGAVIMLVGRLRPFHFGIDLSKLGAGLLYAAMIWLLLNVFFLAFALAANTAVQFDPSWSEPGVRYKISEFAGQIAGNALAEEIIYRGFFLAQVLLLLRTRFEKRPWLWAALAILFSAAIFAVSHAPNRIWQGRYDSALAIVGDQAGLMFGGLFFGWLYLRTQNLFFVIGVHALVNRPTLLLALPENALPPAVVVNTLALLVALIWNKLPRVEARAMKT
ncbi:CPBP family intramembrane metalloprotease [candidate division KSB1 bacterium]|nr:MAG: CPBP family intramembrane metalloprotease [candidate division KSB1 bacterium]MBC6952268.1 CPBP family intramembrane metalloprotease [candidate division KSB1 bacterium]MCE7940288.1 CPBP family intramembrane metalloprotease [Chlorobi bacterium CHB1]MDL1874259.1 CPBP family intramembrane metalloprotease [Cytophagia bacterium CHB2]